MKSSFGVLVFFAIILSYVVEADRTNEFTLHGTLMSGVPLAGDTDSFSMRAGQKVNLASARVVVSAQTENEDGKTSLLELGTGHFKDGEFTFKGTIEGPMDVHISVEVGYEELATLTVVLTPNETISFALIESGSSPPQSTPFCNSCSWARCRCFPHWSALSCTVLRT